MPWLGPDVILHNRHSRRFGKVAKGVRGTRRRCWLISPEGFRELRKSVPLSRKACAEYLGCSVSTVRSWDRGRNRVPWSAVRLLRLLRLGDLGALNASWDGWSLHGDRLVSPEGLSFQASDMAWWSLTCRQAEGFRQAFDGWQRLSEVLRLVLRPVAVEAPGVAGGTPAGGALAATTRPEVPGVAEPVGRPEPLPAEPLLSVVGGCDKRKPVAERSEASGAAGAPDNRDGAGCFSGLVLSTTSGTEKAEIQQECGFQRIEPRVAQGGVGRA